VLAYNLSRAVALPGLLAFFCALMRHFVPIPSQSNLKRIWTFYFAFFKSVLAVGAFSIRRQPFATSSSGRRDVNSAPAMAVQGSLTPCSNAPVLQQHRNQELRSPVRHSLE
jgi:hypothetical protein